MVSIAKSVPVLLLTEQTGRFSDRTEVAGYITCNFLSVFQKGATFGAWPPGVRSLSLDAPLF